MHSTAEMVGKTYNYWRVNKIVGKGKLNCTCLLCGKDYIRYSASIRNGSSKMCLGCYVAHRSDKWEENQRKAVTKHGLSQTRLYNTLDAMHRRCEDESNKSYSAYGARGIRVCKEWAIENVASFVNWALKNGYKDGLQIDRIDVNGNYEPSNCRWVTKKENARNTRTNRLVVVRGEKMTLAEAVERFGQVSYRVTHTRMRRGMSLEDALFTPKMKAGARSKGGTTCGY